MAVTKLIFTLFIAVISTEISTCNAYKSLFIMPSGSKSHMNYYGSIMEALEQNGHEITFVSPYKLELGSKKIRELLIDDIRENSVGNRFELSFFKLIQSLQYVPRQCLNTITNPEVANVMKENYDFVILPFFYSDCFLGYVYEKKIPLINVSPNTIASPFSERIGLPEFWSIYPNFVMPYTYPLSFWERIATALMTITGYHMTLWLMDRRTENFCREQNIWSSETPPISNLQKQGSLTIINSIRALELPIKSTPPSLIYAGGIHIKSPRPLSQDLENWLGGSGEAGFILFSLGTAVKSAQMKEKHFKIIVNVFRSLDQRIIWKWDSEGFEDLPSNVKLISWLPQQDILAHPKIRLFITHGGLFSTQESMHYGVPVIGMPVFADQMFNVAKVVAEGWGHQITWDELTEDKFRTVINETLTDDSLRQSVSRKSKLMRDWPRNPSHEVVYWIEYVLRHNGAKHLQSPLINLYWYEIYNADVWLFILTVLVIIFVPVLLTVRFCFRLGIKRCFKRKLD